MSFEHIVYKNEDAVKDSAAGASMNKSHMNGNPTTQVILYTNPLLFIIDLCTYISPNITSDEPIAELIKDINIYFNTIVSEYKFDIDTPPHINKQKRYYIPFCARIHFDDTVCYKGDYVETINISCTTLFKNMAYIVAFDVSNSNPKTGVFYLRYTGSTMKVLEQKSQEKVFEPMMKALDEYLQQLVSEETVLETNDVNEVYDVVVRSCSDGGCSGDEKSSGDGVEKTSNELSNERVRYSCGDNSQTKTNKKAYIGGTLSSFVLGDIIFNNTNIRIKPKEGTNNVVQLTKLRRLNDIPIIGHFVYKNNKDTGFERRQDNKPKKLEHNVNAEDHLAMCVRCKHCGSRQVVDYYDFDVVSVKNGKVMVDCAECYETFEA